MDNKTLTDLANRIATYRAPAYIGLKALESSWLVQAGRGDGSMTDAAHSTEFTPEQVREGLASLRDWIGDWLEATNDDQADGS